VPPLANAVAVAVGGAAGALARYAVAVAAVAIGASAPWATLTVNLLGSLLMGLLVAAVVEHPARHPLWRPLLGVGFLGGFTTFSAFAGDAVLLADDGAWLAAAGYVAVTVLGGLAALAAGIGLGRRWRGAVAR
jgi:CrcB protein